MISIGAETMDRDFVDFESIRDHIGPLGAKQVRLQAGWAKCEPEPGVYDFGWLDEIIDSVISDGVEPWLQASYGNPVYEGGGGSSLHGGFPTSAEALAAWDRWVYQLSRRYRSRVIRWEIWNEPDLLPGDTAEEYTRLFVRTARIIRSQIPEAHISALALAIPGEEGYTRAFFTSLREQGALDLVDDVSFHGYLPNPDIAYDDVDVEHGRRGTVLPLMRTVREFSPRITIRQGEQGCPSTETVGALRGYNWTELMQAKWALRRLLTDIGHGVPSCYFSIIDMFYLDSHKNPWDGKNTKGLIAANADLSFAYRKPAYRAVQSLTAVFDSTLKLDPGFVWSTELNDRISLYGFRQEHSGYSAVVYWKSAEMPCDSNEVATVPLDFLACRFDCPVLVDVLTGTVHELPDDAWSRAGSTARFTTLPIYDSPVLVADRSCVPIMDDLEGEPQHGTH
jgi:hypothetical protein